ncbi:hypothetical protein SAMN05421823_109128 [Catalinimonas alkaloidigena]|uniref:Uncharacterized protein n=1 Tax=Catalinimonas alkaloidigena TaxID=1075417 RepID=A0A1G9PAG8_9BACT|nr:hypothetical protein [Catalinimonas alkaloidigena]SDL95563.1 hypothetical protein SAMN05421823_109128 [Catalinimonas alkaloidigena]
MNDPVQSLAEIRSMMERSSRFLSLSGLSGIFAGIFALMGAAVAYGLTKDLRRGVGAEGMTWSEAVPWLMLDAAVVLVLALGSGIYFTNRRALRSGQRVWNATSRRFLINLAIPLATGGAFCFLLLHYGAAILVAPTMLIFYGLSLLNASKFTLDEIRYLGISEVLLGLLAGIFAGWGLLFWSLGFGVLHIVYGALMYHKYERA